MLRIDGKFWKSENPQGQKNPEGRKNPENRKNPESRKNRKNPENRKKSDKFFAYLVKSVKSEQMLQFNGKSVNRENPIFE